MIFVKVGLKHFFWGLFPKPIFLMPLPKRLEPLTFNNKCSIDLMSIWTKKWFKLQGLCTNNFLYYPKFKLFWPHFLHSKIIFFLDSMLPKNQLNTQFFQNSQKCFIDNWKPVERVLVLLLRNVYKFSLIKKKVNFGQAHYKPK